MGGGLSLALWCDIRIAAESAVLTAQFPKLGLACESGTSWILPRIVGNSKALDLLWSGRKVDADRQMRQHVFCVESSGVQEHRNGDAGGDARVGSCCVASAARRKSASPLGGSEDRSILQMCIEC